MGCILLSAVDISQMKAWIQAIAFEDWPQQHRLEDGRIRPAMVNMSDWHGFKGVSDPIVEVLGFSGRDYNRMLSVVMPAHRIEPHSDVQEDHWAFRVHVPLTSNSDSVFLVGGVPCALRPGFAYAVDTTIEHAVENNGATPRIHFMFDVRRQ